MADIDILRRSAFERRVKGAGGARIHWTTDQIAEIHDFIMSAPKEMLRTAPQRKFVDSDCGIGALRTKLLGDAVLADDTQQQGEPLKWVFRISSEQVDLMGDVIKIAGWNFDGFDKNAPVLFSHDSRRLAPGDSKFPSRGRFRAVGSGQRDDQGQPNSCRVGRPDSLALFYEP